MSTAYAHFRIEGKFLTGFCRDLVCEGRWGDALRLLVEDLEGMTWDLAIGILRGASKLAGSSDSPEGVHLEDDSEDDPETAAYLQRARSFYAGRFRDGETWYRPYAFITDYGPCDVPSGGIASYRFLRGWSDERMLFYADDRDADRVGVYTFVYNGERRTSAVLFQRTNPPPVWWASNANSPRKALDEWLASGRTLDERGAHQYDLDRPVYRVKPDGSRVEVAKETPAEPAEPADPPPPAEPEEDPEERRVREHQERVAAMRATIEAQAGPKDGDGWLTLTVPAYHVWKAPEPDENGVTTFKANAPETCARCGKTFPEKPYHLEDRVCGAQEPAVHLVPKAPFHRWALNRTHGAHLAPAWTNVAPPSWKLQFDDQDHSDWLIGAGLDDYYGDAAVRDASNGLAYDLQHDLLAFDAHILCGRGWVEGKVLHPKPGEAVPAGSLIVIPFAGPDYTVPATTAGPTGAIITERGGELAHLVVVGREQGLRLVRIPGALEKYPAGVRLSVNCDEGKVEVSTREPWMEDK